MRQVSDTQLLIILNSVIALLYVLMLAALSTAPHLGW
jgi:hypothetical protein